MTDPGALVLVSVANVKVAIWEHIFDIFFAG